MYVRVDVCTHTLEIRENVVAGMTVLEFTWAPRPPLSSLVALIVLKAAIYVVNILMHIGVSVHADSWGKW